MDLVTNGMEFIISISMVASLYPALVEREKERERERKGEREREDSRERRDEGETVGGSSLPVPRLLRTRLYLSNRCPRVFFSLPLQPLPVECIVVAAATCIRETSPTIRL